jgi:hypothetical protein
LQNREFRLLLGIDWEVVSHNDALTFDAEALAVIGLHYKFDYLKHPEMSTDSHKDYQFLHNDEDHPERKSRRQEVHGGDQGQQNQPFFQLYGSEESETS